MKKILGAGRLVTYLNTFYDETIKFNNKNTPYIEKELNVEWLSYIIARAGSKWSFYNLMKYKGLTYW